MLPLLVFFIISLCVVAAQSCAGGAMPINACACNGQGPGSGSCGCSPCEKESFGSSCVPLCSDQFEGCLPDSTCSLCSCPDILCSQYFAGHNGAGTCHYYGEDVIGGRCRHDRTECASAVPNQFSYCGVPKLYKQYDQACYNHCPLNELIQEPAISQICFDDGLQHNCPNGKVCIACRCQIPSPTVFPTPSPTPTFSPSLNPTVLRTPSPTLPPIPMTPRPSPISTPNPTPEPTTAAPTAEPTPLPVGETFSPTLSPSPFPTSFPTSSGSATTSSPTVMNDNPTAAPTPANNPPTAPSVFIDIPTTQPTPSVPSQNEAPMSFNPSAGGAGFADIMDLVPIIASAAALCLLFVCVAAALARCRRVRRANFVGSQLGPVDSGPMTSSGRSSPGRRSRRSSASVTGSRHPYRRHSLSRPRLAQQSFSPSSGTQPTGVANSSSSSSSYVGSGSGQHEYARPSVAPSPVVLGSGGKTSGSPGQQQSYSVAPAPPGQTQHAEYAGHGGRRLSRRSSHARLNQTGGPRKGSAASQYDSPDSPFFTRKVVARQYGAAH